MFCATPLTPLPFYGTRFFVCSFSSKQFPEGSGGGGGGGAGRNERYQPLSYHGYHSKRSLTPSLNYNQVSAGWSDFAEAIDPQNGDVAGGDGGSGTDTSVSGGGGSRSGRGGEGEFGGRRNGLHGWDFGPSDSVPGGFSVLGGDGGGEVRLRSGSILKHTRSAGSLATVASDGPEYSRRASGIRHQATAARAGAGAAGNEGRENN